MSTVKITMRDNAVAVLSDMSDGDAKKFVESLGEHTWTTVHFHGDKKTTRTLVLRSEHIVLIEVLP